MVTLTLNLTVNNYGQLGGLIKSAKDTIEKNKPKKTEEVEKSNTDKPNSENNNQNSAQEKLMQIKPSNVGKIYFSNQPFGTTNEGGKTSFTTGDYIYGRLETGGKTLREAFGFTPVTKENPFNKVIFNLYAYDSSEFSLYGDSAQAVISAINSPNIRFSEADLDKTYWNFDVLPEPAKATTRIYFYIEDYEDQDAGASALYKFLKDRAKAKDYLVKIELVRQTTDFRGNEEPKENWRRVEGRLSLNFNQADFAKIKTNQETLEANRVARLERQTKDRDVAKVESVSLPKEWTLKSNPLLPGLTEANMRVLFQKYGAHYTEKQIIKFYAAPSGSTARKVATNELGIPTHRSFDQWLTIFAKVKFDDGEVSCFYQHFYPAQAYSGGGTYGNLILITQRRVDVSCAKLGVK